MLELKLESVDEWQLPAECFLSMRVGEMQKISRVASGRVFRFPPGNEPRRYGRIEVYQRIGSCSVDIDPANTDAREVSISCREAGFGSLGLKVGVENLAAAKPKPEETAEKAEKAAGKLKAAKKYLNSHGIEVQLSQAMQALLKAKPDNPAEFLALRLMADASGVAKATMPTAVEPTKPTIPVPQKVPHTVRPAELQPFASYYRSIFVSLPPKDMSKILQPFLQAKPKTPSTVGVPTTVSLPSSRNPLALPKETLTKLHDSFPRNIPANGSTTSSWTNSFEDMEAIRQKACCILEKANSDGSLGAALALARQSKPAFGSTSAVAASEQKEHLSLNQEAWITLEGACRSGTLALALEQVRTDTCPKRDDLYYRQLAATTLIEACNNGTLMQAIERASAPSRRWRNNPSVGTWLQPLLVPSIATATVVAPRAVPTMEEEVRRWDIRPSVGTWLQPSTLLMMSDSQESEEAAAAAKIQSRFRKQKTRTEATDRMLKLKAKFRVLLASAVVTGDLDRAMNEVVRDKCGQAASCAPIVTTARPWMPHPSVSLGGLRGNAALIIQPSSRYLLPRKC
eukprot:TRINITY_DN12500_c0_g1_i1.p1 TRINITY_DN12500_c0_g1~~TRINITY_DN12500_c0_g1_i1.p1  ORF type:complete len:588 (+),score=98.04 TRINITY_DN12500_c0_g1_i1:56-1765(+)